MADWSDPELLKALAISIIGLGVGLWWISSRSRSKLKEVKELLDAGILTEEEFAEQKAKLLG